MEKYLGRYSAYAYALLRIVAGLLLWMHGTSKLFAWPIGMRGMEGVTVESYASLLGVAAVIELIAGVMIIVGFKAGWAAFLCSGEMAVAYFMRQFPVQPLPIFQVPGVLGEVTVLNAFIFLYVATMGSGSLSIDALLHRRQAPTAVRHSTTLAN